MVGQALSQHGIAAKGEVIEQQPDRLRPARGALEQNQKCEKFWTLPTSRFGHLSAPRRGHSVYQCDGRTMV